MAHGTPYGRSSDDVCPPQTLLAFGILDVIFAAFFVSIVWLQRTERQREAQRLVTAY